MVPKETNVKLSSCRLHVEVKCSLIHVVVKAAAARTHLNMREVTVLKLQKNLQSALLVELFQRLDGSII